MSVRVIVKAACSYVLPGGLGGGSWGHLQQILGLWPAEDSRRWTGRATARPEALGDFAPLLSAFPADSKADRVLAKF